MRRVELLAVLISILVLPVDTHDNELSWVVCGELLRVLARLVYGKGVLVLVPPLGRLLVPILFIILLKRFPKQ